MSATSSPGYVESPPPAKTRQRAYKPKVRTGCACCKRRRVKCDEAKPSCGGCGRLGLDCVYSSQSSALAQTSSSAAPRIIRPSHVRSEQPAVPLTQWGGNKASGLDSIYFSAFWYKIVQNPVNHGQSIFWSRTLPRDASWDECVRNGILALGALSRALDHEQYRSCNVPLFYLGELSSILSPDYRAALRYYNRALSLFRKRLSRGIDSTDKLVTAMTSRSLLISTLLFGAFELMQGASESADRLMAMCISALGDQLVSHVSGKDQKSQIAALLDDQGVREAEYLLLRMASIRALRLPMYRSQASAMVAFSARPVFVPLPPPTAPVEELEAQLDNLITRFTVWGVATGHCGPMDPETLARAEAERTVFTGMLQEWEAMLVTRLEAESNSAAENQTLTLLVFYTKVALVLAACGVDDARCAWDKNTDMCRGCLEVLRPIIDDLHLRTWHELSFDCKLLPALYSIAQKCRDLAVRSEAMDMCEKLDSLRIDCESRVYWAATKSVVALEEEGRDAEGKVPLHARYTWACWAWDRGFAGLTVTVNSIGEGPEGSGGDVHLDVPKPADGCSSLYRHVPHFVFV